MYSFSFFPTRGFPKRNHSGQKWQEALANLWALHPRRRRRILLIRR